MTRSSGRRRLIFLCQTLPHPPDGGVKIRSNHTLRALAEAYDVTALCFARDDPNGAGPDTNRRLTALSEFARVHAFPIPQVRSRARWAWDHLRSVGRGHVYTSYVYACRAFRQKLTEELRLAEPAVVHVDSLDLSGYLPLVAHLPVACAHHNHESELLRRRAALEDAWPQRAYLQHQAKLMRREEQRWCPVVDLNVVVSDDDRASMAEASPTARFLVLPNGVDTVQFRPASGSPEEDGSVVFVGGTTWFPNRDALDFFSQDIQPRLPGGVVSRVSWVGRCTHAEQARHAQTSGITMTGYVDDIRPHVWRAACYIVPLRVGGGTRLKILDAWALGKAVVSTSAGCEGLATEDGENILIRDDPAAFARAMADVLQNAELRARLGRNARATAERLYSRAALARKLVGAYSHLGEA